MTHIKEANNIEDVSEENLYLYSFLLGKNEINNNQNNDWKNKFKIEFVPIEI